MPNLRHPRIADSLGRQRTLANNAESFTILDLPSHCPAPKTPVNPNEKKFLLLGLGPSLDDARRAVEIAGNAGDRATTVYWLECPAFEQALRDAGLPLPSAEIAATDGGLGEQINERASEWTTEWASKWLTVTPAAALELAARENLTILLYRQNAQLFPEFWGPLLARLRLAALTAAPQLDFGAGFLAAPDAPTTVFLPGSPHDLLHMELEEALRAEGCTPLTPPAVPLDANLLPEHLHNLVRMAEQEHPAFFLSVNLSGLDPAGEVFHLLQAMNIPVAVWFVDNPWHVLSALRLPWWKQASLFVTDPSFISGLRTHGAKRVLPLPLATSSFFANPQTVTVLPPHIKMLFVGRSSFPDRDSFFAAHSDALHVEACPAASPTPLLHFHDLLEQLEIRQLWPGNDVRRAGAAAERGTLALRASMLHEAASLGLAVVGDDGWKPWLQQCPSTPQGLPPLLFPPVDYYTVLPGLYRAAPYSLNATSLLLPGGLTQRHFDVWQAGGFLLSAANSGLTLFPDELAQPITFSTDFPLAERVAYWDSHPSQKLELRHAWHEFVAQNHSYQQRIRFIRKNIGKTLDVSRLQL